MANRLAIANQYRTTTDRTSSAMGGGLFGWSERCPQVSEEPVGTDQFILDVLEFFFVQRLTADQLNDELRELAAVATYEANRASNAMDRVPRPSAGRPTATWLVSQGVQIAFRSLQNQCIYEAVRRTVRARMRSQYELARDGVLAESMMTATPTGPSSAIHSTSPRGIDMIGRLQGFRPSPYDDAAGDCRVGYHHLVHVGPCDGSELHEYGDISKARGRELLVDDASTAEEILRSVGASLEQHQFDALVSFILNVGPEVFQRSAIPGLLSSADHASVADEMGKWVNENGAVVPELQRRRRAEVALYSTGEYAGESAAAELAHVGLSLSEMETSYQLEAEDAIIDWCQIRHNMIRMAVEKQGEWLAASGDLKTEADPSVMDDLVAFWRDGTGMDQAAAEATARISASDHPSEAFWSAAFISWCVRQAMPTPPPPHDAGFLFHMRHMAYIAQAARNRAAADTARPFWLFDINDPEIVPRDGDILCLNRGGTAHSFASVNAAWVDRNPTDVATGSSHTDIVVGSFEDSGRRWIETVGGNVSDTIGSKYYSVDGAGRITDETTLGGTVRRRAVTAGGSPRVFALIRLTACEDLP